MRKETILDIAHRLMSEHKSDWMQALKKEVLGTTVLTAYTNKTYMIDDIDFSKNPSSKFTPAYKEDAIAYYEYYKQRYNIDIRDKHQFLLISKAKERDLRAGKQDLIYLIPELCRATGMTDSMRNDFQLTRQLSEHTRLNPEKRVKALQKFNKRIQSTPESVKVLNEWNMEMETKLLTVPARELPSEPIVFGDGQELPTTAKGEWVFRNNTTMYKSKKIQRWLCIYPKQLEEDTQRFIGVLNQVCDEMKVTITKPIM